MPTLENFATLYETTTTADPGTSGTSLVVTTRTGSPVQGQFRLLVQNSETDKTNREIVLVTAGWGTGAGTFTVSRGQDGTTGVAHPVGSYVALVLTQQSLQRLIPAINPLRAPYNAKGDGATDDAAALTSAITDAINTGLPLVSPPGYTYLIASTLTISGALQADFGGSTIKKAATMNGWALSLTSTGSPRLRNLTVDGNQAAGGLGSGVNILAGTNFFNNVHVQNCKDTTAGTTIGFQVGGTTTTGDFTDCSSDNNVEPLGTGWLVGGAAGLILKMHGNCSASGNTYAGIYLQTSAGPAEIEYFYVTRTGAGSTTRGTGIKAQANKGRIGRLVSVDNNLYGLLLENTGALGVGGSYWQIGTIISRDEGKTDNVAEASAFEITGGTSNNVGQILAYNTQGYVCGFFGGSGGVGSTRNRVGSVLSDTAGDPVVSIGGLSSYNQVGQIISRSGTVALVIGEATTPGANPLDTDLKNNSHNMIGRVFATDSTYAAVVIAMGRYNWIGEVIARNVVTTSPYVAVVEFFTSSGTADATWNASNYIGEIQHKTEGAGTKPTYVLHFGTNGPPTGNRVGKVTHHGDYVTAALKNDATAGINLSGTIPLAVAPTVGQDGDFQYYDDGTARRYYIRVGGTWRYTTLT